MFSIKVLCVKSPFVNVCRCSRSKAYCSLIVVIKCWIGNQHVLECCEVCFMNIIILMSTNTKKSINTIGPLSCFSVFFLKRCLKQMISCWCHIACIFRQLFRVCNIRGCQIFSFEGSRWRSFRRLKFIARCFHIYTVLNRCLFRGTISPQGYQPLSSQYFVLP